MFCGGGGRRAWVGPAWHLSGSALWSMAPSFARGCTSPSSQCLASPALSSSGSKQASQAGRVGRSLTRWRPIGREREPRELAQDLHPGIVIDACFFLASKSLHRRSPPPGLVNLANVLWASEKAARSIASTSAPSESEAAPTPTRHQNRISRAPRGSEPGGHDFSAANTARAGASGRLFAAPG